MPDPPVLLPAIPLKEYFDRRLEDRKEHFTSQIHDLKAWTKERFEMNDSAIAKAERTMNDRLLGMNEFRDALKDTTSLMATRVELNKLDETVQHLASRVEVEKIDRDVRELQRAKANLDGRLLIMSSSISIVVSIVLWLLTRFIK